ncbi:hypothetical protein HG536_0C03640 [Torulaspora globosa]|uniref:Uncharacterized protein n=1 Tax=Torulaspora globosa TaxID=48254 RepID=A0A7G3ZFB0_9SACH|nr:uncharacterized protein HG536_0C03640 [Torulaspora globosa]QLL32196.1 hypothetical protein HG536_0C03640 [Torulaspora globosa]
MNDIAALSNEIFVMCGHLAVEMNMIPLALELVGKVLAKSPGDKAALLLLAKIHLLRKEYGEVLEVLGEGRNDVRLCAIFSLACYRLGLYDRAAEAMRHGKGGEEEDVELELNLNILQCRILLLADLQENPLQATVPQFERTLELTQLYSVPTLHLEALLTRAQLFEKSGDWEKCFFDLEDCITILQNQEAMTHFHIRDFLYKTTFAYLYKIFIQEKIHQESEPADQLFQECFKFPHTIETLHMLTVARGIYSAIVGEKLDVADILSLASAVSAEFKPFVYYITARIIVELGSPENLHRASEYYQLSLELDSSRSYVWISLASLHLKLRQIPDALFAFSKTVELLGSLDVQQYSISRHSYVEREDDLNALSWFGMAQAYLSTNSIDKSLDALQKAINFLGSNELLERHTLDEFGEILRSEDVAAIELLKENMILPEIPLEFFLNPIFYLEETQVFQVESRLERSSSLLPKFSSYNKLPNINSDYRANNNHSANKKPKKRSMRKISEGIKTTKFRNKKKNDIFRRANLSISKGDKNYSNPGRKKHESCKSSIHTSSPNHSHQHNYNLETNVIGVPISSGHNSINTSLDDNSHANTGRIMPQVIQTAGLSPDQQQHFGYLYQSDEQNQPNQVHQHHEAAPHSYPAFISSHNPGIYPASYSHLIRPVGFSASPSFYYPQQSIEEVFRNNSNGLGEQGLSPNFGPPVIMPPFPNPVYIPDGVRFSASSLQPTIIPLMTSQQSQQSRYPSAEGKHADVITYTEDS